MSAKCPAKKKLVLEAVTQFYKEQCPFSAEDMLHIQENFSWVRLMEAMRKNWPGEESATGIKGILQGSIASKRDANWLECWPI